jgi:hypothetical protein
MQQLRLKFCNTRKEHKTEKISTGVYKLKCTIHILGMLHNTTLPPVNTAHKQRQIQLTENKAD